MKKALKIFGYILGGFALLLAGVAAYIQFAPMPTYPVKASDIKINPAALAGQSNSVRIAEGGRIVMTECAHCHRGADGKLSGDIWFNDPALGKVWSANITRDPSVGIGQYTDGELAYLLRTGVKRNGHLAGPFMVFPLMADEDLASVIAFLRSDDPAVQPSPNRQPPAELSFMFKMFMKLIVKPAPYDGNPVVAPSPADQVAYGRYLATGKWSCYRCHSASFETNDDFEPEKSAGFFAGGNPINDKENNIVNAANITPDRETGIGAWTEVQFAEAIRSGKRPDGKGLRPQMPPMTQLTDAEISALWAYLQTVPAVHNPVERNF